MVEARRNVTPRSRIRVRFPAPPCVPSYDVKLLLCVALAALLLAAPASAAQKCVAPPGTAAIEQYCETIPAAGGETGSDDDPGATRPIGDETLGQIQAAAGDEAVRAIAGPQATAPSNAKKPSHRTNPKPAGRSTAPAHVDSNPLDAVASAASSGTEVGGPLVYILLALTLVLASAAWMRFRRSNG